ncbi:hypothetical protein [Pelagibacterium lentulum]|uniref:Uncharacterized protein n=1 Tax=Pelagibacterium lentulum TaxID=2029865 RepID=A0A916RPQ9_9HYPH|nr:hypothetical protein [Pelagibacterium lentulum]GGA63706.1 hypothetical protein GCM10011499_37580 [Pelagibacterium lentulum]
MLHANTSHTPPSRSASASPAPPPLAGPARPHPKPDRGIVEELAEAMIDLNADGGATERRLLERGFSSLDLSMYGQEARQLAAKSFVRKCDRPAYDRAARVSEAAREISHMLPGLPAITMQLQARNFPKRELDDILCDAIAHAADQFAHEGGAA